jgi:hypothetical protein
MIYSDAELVRWWAGLSKFCQAQIMATILERGDRHYADPLVNQYHAGKEFTPKQLASIRKWAP